MKIYFSREQIVKNSRVFPLQIYSKNQFFYIISSKKQITVFFRKKYFFLFLVETLLFFSFGKKFRINVKIFLYIQQTYFFSAAPPKKVSQLTFISYVLRKRNREVSNSTIYLYIQQLFVCFLRQQKNIFHHRKSAQQ